MAVVDTYTVADARRVCGFNTTYMLDYLYRSDVVRPSRSATPGRGRRRLYTFRDLVLLRSVNHLLSRGLPVRKLKLAIHKMREKFPDISLDGLGGAERYLVTNGTAVYLVEREGKIIDLTKNGQMAFVFMLDVETIRNEVAEQVAKLKA